MKFLYYLFLCLCFSLVLHAENVKSEGQEERSQYISDQIGDWVEILDGGGSFDRIFNGLKSLGYTDNEICLNLIQKIEQPKRTPGAKVGYETAKASASALFYYRGNATVEKAVLAACDTTLYEGPLVNPQGFLQSEITYYGSEELIEEYCMMQEKKWGTPAAKLKKYLIDRVSRPRHRREQAPIDSKALSATSKSVDIAAKYTPDAWQPPKQHFNDDPLIGQPDKRQATTTYNAAVSISLCCFGSIILLFGAFKKKKWIIVLGVCVITGAGFFYLYSKRNAVPNKVVSEPDQAPYSKKPNESRIIHAVHTPEAWKPQPVRLPPPQQRRITEFDKLRSVVQNLMSPFFVSDASDRSGNQKAREVAAMKLLDLLEKGIPEGVKEDNWTGIVSQIINCQSCSIACMDRTMKIIDSWIGNPHRSEKETTLALQQMMAWNGKEPVNPDSPELKRFQEIANLQEKLFRKASPEQKAQILVNMAFSDKIVRRPKSIMPEPIVEETRLISLMQELRGESRDHPKVSSDIMLALDYVVNKSPDKYSSFDPMIKEIITDKNTDIVGIMVGLQIIAKASKTTNKLPDWMDDAKISKILRERYEQALHKDDRAPGVQKPGFVAMATWEITQARASVDTAAVAKHYGELMLSAISNADVDKTYRMELLKTATNVGVIDANTAKEKYGNDPIIGVEVAKYLK